MKKAEAVAKDGEALLKRIAGARLTSVQFVMNYLILGFDERGALTTLVWPEIRNRELRQRFGTTGYRDSLCQLITRIVESATISEDEEITISFSNGVELFIPLGTLVSSGERAIFTAPKHVLHVW